MPSTNLSSQGGSVYASSPVQTRAQRKKKATTISLNKQQKIQKAANREARALPRFLKSKKATSNPSLDPDEVQWHICLNDIIKRKKEAKAATSTPIDDTAEESQQGN